jgi:hypothetical protein
MQQDFFVWTPDASFGQRPRVVGVARYGASSRKSALARIGRRNQQRAECCRQELTKHAPRSHDWILREPLWTNQQRSHIVVFNSIGELLEDLLVDVVGVVRRPARVGHPPCRGWTARP